MLVGRGKQKITGGTPRHICINIGFHLLRTCILESVNSPCQSFDCNYMSFLSFKETSCALWWHGYLTLLYKGQGRINGIFPSLQSSLDVAYEPLPILAESEVLEALGRDL